MTLSALIFHFPDKNIPWNGCNLTIPSWVSSETTRGATSLHRGLGISFLTMQAAGAHFQTPLKPRGRVLVGFGVRSSNAHRLGRASDGAESRQQTSEAFFRVPSGHKALTF